MNDRFLFRGKQKHGKDWLVGTLSYYSLDDEFNNEMAAAQDDYHIFPISGVPDSVDNYAIDPATVDQSTGLRDKNGVLIFEGDIVKYRSIPFEVKWIAEDGRLLAVSSFSWNSQQSKYTTGCGNTVSSLSADMRKGFEVIGNIHDNPYLLKGAGTK